jgi:xanthine dehydrogenase small subunit
MAKAKSRSELRFILNGDEDPLSCAMSRRTTRCLIICRLRRSLKGTKEGCAEGDCGACTVLVGRLHGGKLVYESVNACIRFLGSLDGTHIVTIEYLREAGGKLFTPCSRPWSIFMARSAGFCTPGFVMSLYGLWMRAPNPATAAGREGAAGQSLPLHRI